MTKKYRFANLINNRPNILAGTSNMDEAIVSKNYELAFHINPDLGEPEVMVQAKELADLIKNGNGIILSSREPKRVRLSYPINKKRAAYFGIIDFASGSEFIEKLNSQIRLNNNVFRHILINLPSDMQNMRILGEHRSRARTRTRAQEEKKEISVREKEKSAESSERLEQDIEKVIGDL